MTDNESHAGQAKGAMNLAFDRLKGDALESFGDAAEQVRLGISHLLSAKYKFNKAAGEVREAQRPYEDALAGSSADEAAAILGGFAKLLAYSTNNLDQTTNALNILWTIDPALPGTVFSDITKANDAYGQRLG